MKAVILAAGKGKRMRPLTKSLPKPLLIVGGRSFLDHIFSALPKVVNEVIIVIGYRGNKIKQTIGENYLGRKVEYITQKKLNGTGPALLLSKKYFNNNQKDRFLIIYGDEVLKKSDIQRCLEFKFSWLCRKAKNPKKSGIVTLAKDGRILEVQEKPKQPKSNLAGAGLMVVDTDIFKFKPINHRTGELYLTSMMSEFLKRKKVYAVIGRRRLSFSTPEDIKTFVKKYK